MLCGDEVCGPSRQPASTVSCVLAAGVIQLVECQLPKLDVAGSSPVARSVVMVKVVVGLKGIQYALKNHEDSGYEHDSQWRVGWIFKIDRVDKQLENCFRTF